MTLSPTENMDISISPEQSPFAKTRHGIAGLALAMLLNTTTANAQDSNTTAVQYAELSPTILALQAGEIQSDALPPELAWVANLDLTNPDISDLLRMRTTGFEYYAPALQELSKLTPEGQAFIANTLSNPIGGPDLNEGTIELIRDLRVPESLRDAILQEAIASGADVDWDIPAFDEALQELRTGGNTGAETLGDLFKFAPKSASRLYIVLISQALIEERAVSEGVLRDSEGRLVDSEGRLVNAQEAERIAAELRQTSQEAADAAQELKN